MAKIIVLGGGVCGLASGILLARDGHEVTLLERDPHPPPASPEEAWENWGRDGVTQFRQAHFLHSRGSEIIKTEFPEVQRGLIDAGAAVVNPLLRMPPFITDHEPRPIDSKLATHTARRATIEQLFGTVAESEDGLKIRRGVSVAGLLNGAGTEIPHIRGVRTESGEELDADLVVDATGRRSSLPKWLAAEGCASILEEAEDSGFSYYSRFYRSSDGTVPESYGPLLSPIGSFSILTLPGDADTWSVTLFVASGDQPLKRFRFAETFEAVVRACPAHAHWLEGEPITEVDSMGGLIDRYRRLVSDGRPVATGVVAVADAWACTNPSLGRGITLGLAHALRLRDVARDELDDPLGFAEAFDEMTERELTPWYRGTLAVDRARLAEMEALRNGLEPPGPPDFGAGLGRALDAAAPHDPDVFRAMLEIVGCHTLPDEVFARPGMVERVVELAEDHPPIEWPGPSREQLLQLVAEQPAGA